VRPSLASFALASSLTTLASSAAFASPWTLPPGTLVMAGTYNYQTARREFLDASTSQNFPLQGRYVGSAWSLGARLGVTRRFELELYLPLRVVSYESDPVILIPRPATSNESEFDYYQRNIVQLSRTATGIGDIFVAGRYGILQRPFALAAELRLKIPTGYASPSGTFGDQPQSAASFAANPGLYTRPENVSDDVTLGDGQVDAALSVLWGYSFPTRTYVRVDAGYNLRFGGAGDQFIGALRAGQLFGDRFLVYANLQLVYTVTQGRVIGVSVAARNPDLAAGDYLLTNNLNLREVRLERDALDVGGGFIVRLTPEVEVNVGYNRTVLGRNTAATDSVSLGIAVRTQTWTPR